MQRSTNSLVFTILEYLIQHPESKDTIDGIKRWWLGRGGEQVSLEEVEDALDALIGYGLLEETVIGGDMKVFSLRPGQQTNAARFLGDFMGGGDQS